MANHYSHDLKRIYGKRHLLAILDWAGRAAGRMRFASLACYCVGQCMGQLWVDVYSITKTMERIYECREGECGQENITYYGDTKEFMDIVDVDRFVPILSSQKRFSLGVPVRGGCSCE